MGFANLYIIDNKSLNVFDFCGLVHLCKRDCNIGAVFVDDIDLLSLSTELSSLKPSKILQWSTILFKALARSLNIPVLIQEFVADIHAPSQIQPPTSDNAVSHRELIEDIPDRILVVCYEEDKDTPNYTVLKDNKYSTGKVIFETPCPF